MKKIIPAIMRKAAFVICIVVFVCSAGQIAVKVYGYIHDDQQFQKIRLQARTESPVERSGNSSGGSGGSPSAGIRSRPADGIRQDSSASAGEKAGAESDPEEGTEPATQGTPDGQHDAMPGYSALRNKNKDMVGWISFPGFEKALDYPVMQAADNEYYLTRDFYKNSSSAGSIFMDYRNNPRQADRNIILYGHAMRDRSMFGNLKEYPTDEEKCGKYKKIYLDLGDARMEYEVFSAYIADASCNYRQTEFKNDEEYARFLKEIQSRSVYDFGVKLSEEDRILTLSTCNRTHIKNGRAVVHAKWIRR